MDGLNTSARGRPGRSSRTPFGLPGAAVAVAVLLGGVLLVLFANPAVAGNWPIVPASALLAAPAEPADEADDASLEEMLEGLEEEPTEEATEEPTEEATEDPTEDATEEPTEEATEDPTEEATEDPTEEATEEPAEEPVEEDVTEEPMEEDATAEPAEEPEPAPAPAKAAPAKAAPAKASPAKAAPAAAPKSSGGLGRPSAPAPSRAPAVSGSKDIFRDLGLTREARVEESKGLLKLGREAKDNGDLVRAEGLLAQAVALDPENGPAAVLLSETRMLLGDTGGAVPGIFRWVKDEVTVQQELAVTEVRRLIQQAAAAREAGDFEKAQTLLERSIESIRFFPFNLDLDADLRQAQSMLETVKQERVAAEEAEDQRTKRMIKDVSIADAAKSTRYLENQVRLLLRRAEIAEKEKKYDRAITLYERILSIKPSDEDVKLRLLRVKEERHVAKMGEYFQKAIENYELAVVGIEESSVVYQQIFRYPEGREWMRISPKVVSIEEEMAATESVIEKEIRRKLDDPYEIGFEEGVALKEALSALQSISSVNFVLNKDGAAAADTTVKLPRFPDLPLKNVLNLLLEAAGENFTYAIKEGAVVIGPKESLKEREYLRFYEISDLIATRPDFKAPKVALDELAGRADAAAPLAIDAGAEVKTGSGIEKERLLELIKSELGEGDAEAEGISMMSGKLAARTTIEKHLKLAKLLDQFRESAGMMVTVESRFLDIQDNFLEEIGIDFGNPNSSNLPNSIPDIDGNGTSVAPGYEYIDPSGSPNVRLASIGQLSQPLGSRVNPFSISSSGGTAFQFNVLKAERYQLEAVLTAVAKEQEIRRLNSPRVTAFNGQIAHTLVVNQAAYIQDLEVNQTGVIPVINPVIDVLNSGSILEVRPTVGYDRKYVVLEIQPTLAEQLDSDIAVLNLSGNFTVVPVELPVLSVTKIKTTVTVPDGGTVLVGGLKREISNKAQIGIPGFLDLPVLNLLSGRKGMSKLRSNLFVLINAKITVVKEEEERVFGTEAL